MHQRYNRSMGVTVQVRNLDPEVLGFLKTLARERGVSLSEVLRRELTRVAERERIRHRWDDVIAQHQARVKVLRQTPPEPREPLNIDTQTIVDVIREVRDER
jgi:hypothetical protein